MRKEVAARTILTPRSEVSQHVPLSVPSIAGMELVHTSGSSINEFIAGHYLSMRGSLASDQGLFNDDMQDLHPQAVRTDNVQTQRHTELSQDRSLHIAHLNTACKCTAGLAHSKELQSRCISNKAVKKSPAVSIFVIQALWQPKSIICYISTIPAGSQFTGCSQPHLHQSCLFQQQLSQSCAHTLEGFCRNISEKAFTLFCGFAASLLNALHMAMMCNRHCRFVQAATRIVAQSQHESGSSSCEVSWQ